MANCGKKLQVEWGSSSTYQGRENHFWRILDTFSNHSKLAFWSWLVQAEAAGGDFGFGVVFGADWGAGNPAKDSKLADVI